jgi:hypothetical protein
MSDIHPHDLNSMTGWMYRCYYRFARKNTSLPRTPVRKRPDVKLYALEIQDRLLPSMQRGPLSAWLPT